MALPTESIHHESDFTHWNRPGARLPGYGAPAAGDRRFMLSRFRYIRITRPMPENCAETSAANANNQLFFISL